MTERQNLSELKFLISHRSCQDGHCDRMDYEVVASVIRALRSKYKRQAEIDYFDYEIKPHPDIQTEEGIFNHVWGAIVFLIEGDPGESQVRGFNLYKQYRDRKLKVPEGIELPRMFVFIKRPRGMSDKDFEEYRDKVRETFDVETRDFFDSEGLQQQLENLLDKDKFAWVGRWLKSHRRRRFPRWIILTFAAAVLVSLLALGVHRFGDRGSGSKKEGLRQLIEHVFNREETQTPSQDPVPGDGVPADDPPEDVPRHDDPIPVQPSIPSDNEDPPGGTNTDPLETPVSSAWTDDQKIAGGLVYVIAKGKSQSGPYDNFEIKIKNMVTSAGLKKTADKSRALWTVEVTGKAREYNEVDGIFFSYVDIKLDIRNTVTGDEIHSGALVVPNSKRDGIKGGSGKSYEDAAITAYQNAYPLIEEQIKRIKSDNQ